VTLAVLSADWFGYCSPGDNSLGDSSLETITWNIHQLCGEFTTQAAINLSKSTRWSVVQWRI